MSNFYSNAGFNRKSLDAYWMAFTANREFKENPRIITAADGCYYTSADNRQIFDGLSGLWCSGIGHNRHEINQAITQQVQQLDYAPSFQHGHPKAFELANKLVEFMPDQLNRVFFTNSGSEAIDTAIKIARGYWRKKGQASKTRMIGRIRGYHGVNYGGISIGGIGPNRAIYGQGIEADHLVDTVLPQNAFSKGLPQEGAYLAEELLKLIALHDASNIAAVVVEPVAGSTGVLPPPKGYLKRLREICDQHNILLIFDEVITGLGRMGSFTAAKEFDVTPDIMTLAKQLTNGIVPMGAVVCHQNIYDTFMEQDGPDYMVEFFHGYTYSAHPLACAAALTSLDILQQEALPQRVKSLSSYFEQSVHNLKGEPHLTDIRNYGFAAGLTLQAYENESAKRPWQVAMKCWENGLYVRYGGDTIQLGIPFISEKEHIDRLVNILSDALRSVN